MAVGAPYDERGGAVYIYLGSPSGIKTTPSQIIYGQDIVAASDGRVRTMKTFGYAISGGIDLDENGYPDMVVGAYESDAIIILRARPIIDIQTHVRGQLSNIDPNRLGCEMDPNSKLVCFSFDTCFEVRQTPHIRWSHHMRVKYRLEAETFTGKKYYRVKFNATQNTDTPNIVESEIDIRSKHF